MTKNLVILMMKYNWERERYEGVLIEDPAGVREVQEWLDRNSRNILPLNQVGAVIEACSLLISPRDALDSPDHKWVVLYGMIDETRRAIEEAELKKLFAIFSNYGKPWPVRRWTTAGGDPSRKRKGKR